MAKVPGAGELRSKFTSTIGGVLTDEAGTVTGDLELLTRPTPDGRGVEALVRYQGAQDLYTVFGSPVKAISRFPDTVEHQQAHERILVALTTPGVVEKGNERPVSLLD